MSTENFDDNARNRTMYVMPEGVDVLRVFERLEINIKNTEGKLAAIRKADLYQLVLWYVPASVFMMIAIMSKSFLLITFVGIFMLSGIRMVRSVLHEYFNTVDIIIKDGKLTVTSRPYQILAKSVTLSLDDINQLFVKQVHAGIWNQQKPLYGHNLYAKTSKGNIALYERGLKTHVLFLEQEIERHLQLADTHVTKDEVL